MQFDETDSRLIALLSENARAPVATLARKLSIARTTVQARIERLEKSGAIDGYTIRKGALSRPPLRATVLIGVEPRSGPAVLARLSALPAAHPVALGPRILRADTAAVAALTLWQTACGDWA